MDNLVRLNIGCGPTGQIENFINIDNSPSIYIGKFPVVKRILFSLGLINKNQYEANWSNVLFCDASKKLPFDSETVDKIYTSHFLEHIPANKGEKVLRECLRVLKPGGVIRIVIPDLLWYANEYVNATRQILSNDPGSDDRSIHDGFLNTMYGAYLQKRRYGAEHCYMYDLPTIFSVLNSLGYIDVKFKV